MKFKLICCEVFLREVCMAAARSVNTIDPEFTPQGAHDNPDRLRELLQCKIDAIQENEGYDAVLLGYGICGNSTVGLTARSIPMVIPRAHDCCTIFLGSRSKFLECFKDNLSAEWSSTGYMERGDSFLRESDSGRLLGLDKTYQEYVEQYGEENAKYIWEALHPPSHDDEFIFIETKETAHLGYLQKLRDLAEKQGKGVRVLKGDTRLIKGLMQGNWDEKEYLVVPPGSTIKGVYDHNVVITV